MKLTTLSPTTILDQRHLSRHRPLAAQLSIQPNIPQHMRLQTRNSTNSIVTQVDPNQPKHVLHQNHKSFAVKKFRMRSLLWVKPQGQAETSTKSTIAQVNHFLLT
jgi:hypothetical protein